MSLEGYPGRPWKRSSASSRIWRHKPCMIFPDIPPTTFISSAEMRLSLFCTFSALLARIPRAGEQPGNRRDLPARQMAPDLLRLLPSPWYNCPNIPSIPSRHVIPPALHPRSNLRNSMASNTYSQGGTARGNGAATLSDLARSGNHTQSDRGAENLKVMIVDLVFQPFLSDLIETLELVEIDGVTIRHKQTVKNHGHPPLLAEACRSNLLRLAQNNRSLGNDHVLMIVRIQRI